jgi:hypothetical protein
MTCEVLTFQLDEMSHAIRRMRADAPGRGNGQATM